MRTERLSRCNLFCEAGNDWKIILDGLSMTWVISVKALVSGLTRADAVRLPGWGQRNPRKK